MHSLVPDPAPFPEGFSVDAVDWLPSGARSGLVRVRGHRPPAVAGPLPELIVEHDGQTQRFVSLPDPRADRDPSAWRGAYVLDARPVAEADQLCLEWPGGRRIQLPALSVPAHQVEQAQESGPVSGPIEAGGEVVDRAVLAERRARRAEASEQAQARIAREALRAVEVLELRASELEQKVAAAEAERDAVRQQSDVEPDVRMEVLSAEVRELRAALADAERTEPAPAPAPDVLAEPIRAGDAERRAERLRTALTATVATVAELRMQLHERDVARRTRDVAIAAELVRLAVIDSEQETLSAELDEARVALREAQTSRDEAAAEAAGARAALDDLQTRHRDLTAELGAARERMATLEADVVALTEEADRTASEADDLHDLRERLARAEAERDRAETARELAEATALAAATRRQAEAVAEASTPRTRPDLPLREVPTGSPEPAPSMPAVVDLKTAAEIQAKRAAELSVPDTQVVADLDAAREKLRATIVSAPGEPPADLARGRGGRELPPLRGALVKLAHDDPRAAGLFLAGLLSAQHAAVVDAPPDYDITITEVGSFAVSTAGMTTLVSPLHEPRGRGQAAFHITTDALTLAETLAGAENRARRFRGPLRVTGKARHAKTLSNLRSNLSFIDVVRAGADLDPHLVLRALSYAVRPNWTQGQVWSVELDVEGRVVSVQARHSGGLEVTDGVGGDGISEPDARVRLTDQAFRDLAVGEAPSYVTEGDESVVRRLLTLAERARNGDN